MKNFSDILLEKATQTAKTQPMGCPCCEAKAEVLFNSSIYCDTGLLRASDKFYKICCSECSIQTSSYKTEDEVISVWNTRPNRNQIFRTFPV